MDERFRRDERIRSKKDFTDIYRKGARIRGRDFNLVFRSNDLGHGRLGVVVSKKVGPAVVRNRIKRRFRDVYRRNKCAVPGALDIVVVTKPGMAAASRPEIERMFLEALGKIV